MKWVEFVQDGKGVGSSTRLVFIGGFGISSLVILWLTYTGEMTEGILGIFLTYCVGGYGIGKYRDSKEVIAETEAEKPAPTVISAKTDVKTDTGDINVTPKKGKKK